jgi:hypothetical protein
VSSGAPSIRTLFDLTAGLAADYLEALPGRPAGWLVDVDELRSRLGGPLPEAPTDPRDVIADLAAGVEPGLVASPGGRYFGFVIGGTEPAAVAADWLTSAWDQNAGLFVCCPSSAVAEEVAGAWLTELLGLPSGVGFGLVTGCQMAHVTALAAARHSVFARADWDVGERGLIGAPPVRVLAGAERHVTVDRALRLLGFGTGSVTAIPADDQGRMIPGALRQAIGAGDGPAIVCAQAGNVNTGAFDDLDAIADVAEEVGAWLHIDGAFGLWAAASPAHRHLVAGADRADSWAVDAHKWLNVPYESGLAFCAHPEAQRAAMGARASYLVHADPGGPRDALEWNPEFSRRERRTDRPLLRARPALRRRALRGAGRGGAQRRCPQPGAGALPGRVRRPRRSHRCGHRGGPERRHLLAERDDLAGHARDAHFGVQPRHPDRRRGRFHRGDPLRRRRTAAPSLTRPYWG